MVDWGVAQLGEDSDAEFCRRAEALIEQYRPNVLVLEDDSNVRRGQKTQGRIEAGHGLAKILDIETLVVGPGDLREALDLALTATKHNIAARIVEIFPELARKTPRKRIWQRDPRMRLFDAVALALAAVDE